MRLHSLTTKFAIANILPTLILIPLLCLYLLYAVENLFTRMMLDRLAQQDVARQSSARQDIAGQESAGRAPQALMPALAHHPGAAQQILANLQRQVAQPPRRAADDMRVTNLWGALETGTLTQSQMALPTGPLNAPQRMALANEIVDIQAELALLRWLVLAGAGVTIVLGLGLGVELARTVTGPVQQLTRQIQTLAAGKSPVRVTVQRQDEIGVLAQKFNEMAERLQAAEVQRQRQLAATVHELARPLTGMRAAVETLADAAENDRELAIELLAGVGAEIERLERLLATLHGLDQRVLQPLQLRRSNLELGRVLQASLVPYEAAAEKGGIRLSSNIAPDLPPVYADEDRVIQLVVNLLDNALKFTPPGGEVMLSATVTTGTVTTGTVTKDTDATGVALIRVTDSGVGIGPDEVPYLFTHFYRGAESRPLEKRGMGLGLAICREIVTAHGGEIWVESQLNQGTTMHFTLPFAATPVPMSHSTPAPHAGTRPLHHTPT